MNRKLQATLALVAVLSFGLYILGCVGYAAWNADSTKLLIPYYSPEAKEWGVVLYDLKARTSRKLMTQSGVDRADMSMQAQWVREATQPFITITRKGRGKDDAKHLDAYLVPVHNGTALRSWLLPNLGDVRADGPFTEVGTKLFVPSSSLAVIDVQDGTSEVVNYDENEEPIVSLASNGGRVYYVRGADRPAPTPDNASATEGGIQFGELNLTGFKRVPYFELFESDLKAQNADLEGKDLIVEQGGTRLAMLGKQGDADAVLIFSSAHLERALVPKLPVPDCHLGSFTWPRSDLIYAIVACPAGDSISQVSAAEISVNDSSVRLVPILRVNDKGLSDDFEQVLKMSLAPNGRTLAITTTVLDDETVTPDNRALFLVDLRSPGRHVSKIAIHGVTRVAGH